jgi:glycosyltransferase involved in cell wall biosynthesis
MSMKTPVVSSKIAGVPEIVKEGETGYMVEPGKSDQLAEAISKMWSDQSAYKKMSENGHKLMEEEFNKDQQFNYFLKYFYQVCEKR